MSALPTAGPVDGRMFAAAMRAVGPFEACPHVAVAVSGGADSLALCLLAEGWARARGGEVTALTVDHRLRAGSGQEARAVGRWLAARGIRHRVLPWTGARPHSAIQATARRVRYALLTGWCHEAGVLHLLLGHHRGDQAETVLMRRERGSGPSGLAAMAPIVERGAVRWLRPLLAVPPERLRAVLLAAGQPWVEDPSNRDPHYLRTRVRARLAAQGNGAETARLVRFAAERGAERRARDAAASGLLARAAAVHPAGYAWLDPHVLAGAPRGVVLTALHGLLAALGGREFGPPADKLERLLGEVVLAAPAKGGSLGGCRVVRRRDRFLVCRETRHLPPPLPVGGGESLVWDRRFRIVCERLDGGDNAPVRLLPLGDGGWREVIGERPELSRHPLPAPARAALPALADAGGVFSVPHLGFVRSKGPAVAMRFKSLSFCPPNPVTGAGCFLAHGEWDTMSDW